MQLQAALSSQLYLLKYICLSSPGKFLHLRQAAFHLSWTSPPLNLAAKPCCNSTPPSYTSMRLLTRFFATCLHPHVVSCPFSWVALPWGSRTFMIWLAITNVSVYLTYPCQRVSNWEGNSRIKIVYFKRVVKSVLPLQSTTSIDVRKRYLMVGSPIIGRGSCEGGISFSITSEKPSFSFSLIATDSMRDRWPPI